MFPEMQILFHQSLFLPSRKLSKLDEPDSQDTTGEARTNSSVMNSYGPPHMAKQKQDDQLEHTYSSYVRIRDVALRTCQHRWMIRRSGERGSEISVLAARHDDADGDDDDRYMYVCIFVCMYVFIEILRRVRDVTQDWDFSGLNLNWSHFFLSLTDCLNEAKEPARYIV